MNIASDLVALLRLIGIAIFFWLIPWLINIWLSNILTLFFLLTDWNCISWRDGFLRSGEHIYWLREWPLAYFLSSGFGVGNDGADSTDEGFLLSDIHLAEVSGIKNPQTECNEPPPTSIQNPRFSMSLNLDNASNFLALFFDLGLVLPFAR